MVDAAKKKKKKTLVITRAATVDRTLGSTFQPSNRCLALTHSVPYSLADNHCALHITRKAAPERPQRLQYVMSALKHLAQEHASEAKLDIREEKTSAPMLEALAGQCCALARNGAIGMPALKRSVSVGYLEEKIGMLPRSTLRPVLARRASGLLAMAPLPSMLRCPLAGMGHFPQPRPEPRTSLPTSTPP